MKILNNPSPSEQTIKQIKNIIEKSNKIKNSNISVTSSYYWIKQAQFIQIKSESRHKKTR